VAKTILIVEDNEMNMRLFNDLLQAHGYNILQSVDGMNCMQLARELRPDLIIMDIQLPILSGIEHARMLKGDDDLKGIPVIACTANAMEGDEIKMLEGDFDGFIAKPINVKDFLDEVKRFLQAGRFRLTNALKIGHLQIDAEHEQIVLLANEFVDCVEKGDDSACAERITALTNAFKNHLESEDLIMKELGYFHFEKHHEEHLLGIKYFDKLIEEAERNGYRDDDFSNKLMCLFADFIVSNDLGFKMYLEKINYQNP
jgi:two-component system, cell cycle response regulator DivK